MQKIITKYNKFKMSTLKLKALKDEKTEILSNKIAEKQKLDSSLYEINKVRALLEQCNIVSRDFIKIEVEQLVTRGLRTIFSNPQIQFNIEFVEKRNQTEAVFFLTSEKEDRIESDLTFAHGGGVIDIISISLRLIIMQLLKLNGPIILDEPGKNISAQYIANFGLFLMQTAKAFDRQIIMITHNDTLISYASNIIEVEKKGDKSFVNVKKRN